MEMNQFFLKSDDELTTQIIEAGIVTWNDLVRSVQNFHYARNANRFDLDLVWHERKGTCSSKHAFLKHISELNKIPNVNLVISGSLGKGLAMPAGIILGKKEVIEGIKSQPIFSGASPGSPANLQAFLETQDIYKAQSQKIRDFSSIFHQETRDLSTISGSANFPVFILKDPTWSDELEKMGFITSSFSYPTPESPRISRIVISGFHSLWDLMALKEALHKLSVKK